MGNTSISPKWESAEELCRRATTGESDALIQLSRLADQAQDDDDIELYVRFFDKSAMLYAMGQLDDRTTEWQEFRQVINFFNNIRDLQTELANALASERRLNFEAAVLEEASITADTDALRKDFSESRQTSAYAVQFTKSDIQRLEIEISKAEFILKIAKKKLSHPRFTSLPDDVLDELIETVSFTVNELEDIDEDNTEDEKGSDDEGSRPEDFLFDDCPTCQELKKTLSHKETSSQN